MREATAAGERRVLRRDAGDPGAASAARRLRGEHHGAGRRAGPVVEPPLALQARLHSEQGRGDPDRISASAGSTRSRRSRRSARSVRSIAPHLYISEIRTMKADSSLAQSGVRARHRRHPLHLEAGGCRARAPAADRRRTGAVRRAPALGQGVVLGEIVPARMSAASTRSTRNCPRSGSWPTGSTRAASSATTTCSAPSSPASGSRATFTRGTEHSPSYTQR